MVKRFEKWLDTFDGFEKGKSVRMIFDDAIKCYVHDIPRPALLLSFVAFLEAIRNKILLSNKPNGYEDGEWDNIRRNVQKLNAWEEEVLNCIFKEGNSQSGKQAIFDIPTSLREDVKYWKNRRNDCAHYKNNEISLAHVTALWQFIMSNYSLFSPIGSIEEIANDFNIHFDISLTPPHQDYTLLYERLKLLIKSSNDIKRFCRLVASTLKEELVEILKNLSHEVSPIKEYALEILKEDERFSFKYLNKYPSEIATVYGNNATMIRKMWYDSMLSPFFYPYLLQNSLIPIDQLEESMKRYLKIHYDSKSFVCPPDCIQVLISNNIVSVFLKEYLDKDYFINHYESINNRSRFYIKIILAIGLTDEIVKGLDNAFSGNNYPYVLRNELVSYFNDGSLDKSKYLQAITKLGLSNSLNIK